ncbi:hypothetical protein [Labilibacter marinus]|uniref:hypothetical protein n=1 Tax=Labilibacter marinus TaxID=1477105 RepID=UPI00082DCA23|nr:hypothetical protein [Labilibacter marinus]
MSKEVFIILIIVLGLQGCKEQEDSYSVYDDVLLEVIGTGSYHIPFNSIFQYDSITQRKLWGEYVESKNRPVEKRRLFLEVSSSLDVHPWDISDLTNLYVEVSLCDSILISTLVAPTKKKEVMDFKKMSVIGRYELYPQNRELGLRTFIKNNDDKYRDVGFIAISKVAFTDDYQKGCFLFTMIDPGGHGHRPRLIFVEKGIGKWKILKEMSM